MGMSLTLSSYTMSDSCPPKILDEMHQANSLQQNQTKHHLKKVLLSSAFIVVPMVAFTITVLVVLFSNVVDLDYCPPSQLCNHTVTAGMNSTDYYVDFPVGRLAFVASLSSTFSLALVAAIMTMYGYVVAKQVLSLPEDLGQQTGSPSSHEMSTLIRVLNGEIILLYDLTVRGCRHLFRRDARRRDKSQPTSRILRLCCVVFVTGICTRSGLTLHS